MEAIVGGHIEPWREQCSNEACSSAQQLNINLHSAPSKVQTGENVTFCMVVAMMSGKEMLPGSLQPSSSAQCRHNLNASYRGP